MAEGGDRTSCSHGGGGWGAAGTGERQREGVGWIRLGMGRVDIWG
jgi:hypothetical protein